MSRYIADRGIIYVALNTTADTVAAVSARSVKEQMPGIHITVFTDQNTTESVFDNVVKIPSQSPIPSLHDAPQYPHQGIIAKATYMCESPYKSTIFLDMDTYIIGDLSPVYDVLENSNQRRYGFYQVAAVMDEAYMRLYQYPELPVCLPRYNTGFFAWIWDKDTRWLFQDFLDYFIEGGIAMSDCDEIPMARAIHNSNVHVLTLPPEYNCRFIYPYILRHKARVLHGRPDANGYGELAKRVNRGMPAIDSDLGLYRVGYEGWTIATFKPIVGLELGEPHD